MNTHSDAIAQTINFVRTSLFAAEGGHDWQHIDRVHKNAKLIAAKETDLNILVVELGALLHDIADSKFHDGNEDIGPATARSFLESIGLEEDIISHVENIVRHISFKSSLEAQTWTSKELHVVQDADRLDALGATGIARMFTYGGHSGRPLYDPAIAPSLAMSKEEYKKHNGPTFNHFYEKLLLLKDLMNTHTGKEIAEVRHKYMLEYIEQFLAEVQGER